MSERIQIDINAGFKECVRACAQDTQFVQRFNALYGARLQVPIQALIDPAANVTNIEDSAEAEGLAAFIMFAYMNVWRRVLSAKRRFALETNRSRGASLFFRDNEGGPISGNLSK